MKIIKLTLSAIGCLIAAILITLGIHFFSPRSADYYVEPSTFTGRNYGTTFITSYGSKKFTITNKHVCDYANSLHDNLGIIMIDGRKEYIIKISEDTDLCLVTYSGNKVGSLKISNVTPNGVDKIRAIGFSAGGPKMISDGYVRGFGKKIFGWVGFNLVDYFSMWLPCQGGCSGSPILNEDDEVVGVLFAGQPNSIFDTYAIPNQNLLKFIEDNYHLI